MNLATAEAPKPRISRLTRRTALSLVSAVALAVGLATPMQSQKSTWRQATDAELAALLPARAPVEKEHIETEMRTASGITDGKGHFIAGVVLITAGYSADGKYSHFLVVQSPIKVAGINLAPGDYVFGWQRDKDGESLNVHLHEAQSGRLMVNAQARRLTGNLRVEQLRIWPPTEKPMIQIGRFGLSYEVVEP
jgi:hypothetical protein